MGTHIITTIDGGRGIGIDFQKRQRKTFTFRCSCSGGVEWRCIYFFLAQGYSFSSRWYAFLVCQGKGDFGTHTFKLLGGVGREGGRQGYMYFLCFLYTSIISTRLLVDGVVCQS